MMLQTPITFKIKEARPPASSAEGRTAVVLGKPEPISRNAHVVRQVYMSDVEIDDQEWNKSQALAHRPRNSSFFFRCVSGLSMPRPNGPRRGSGPLPRGGVPMSRSYSARPRLRPWPLRPDSPLTRLIEGLPGVAP